MSMHAKKGWCSWSYDRHCIASCIFIIFNSIHICNCSCVVAWSAAQVTDMYPAEGAEIIAGIEAVLAQKNQRNQARKESDSFSVPSLSREHSKVAVLSTPPDKRRRSSIAQFFSSLKPTPRKVIPLDSDFDSDDYGHPLSSQQQSMRGFNTDGSKEDLAKEPVPEGVTEASVEKRVWDSAMLFAIIYIYFMVPLRFAIVLNPLLYIVDYLVDGVLILDSVLKWTYWPVKEAGVLLYHSVDIRRAYTAKHLWLDVLTRFPYDIIVLATWNLDKESIALVMACLRLPKLLLIIRSVKMFAQLESILSEIRFPFFYVRLCEVIIGCLLVGHWLGCGFLVLANVSSTVCYIHSWMCIILIIRMIHDFIQRDYGPCVNKPDELYESACEYRGTWVMYLIITDKLNQYGGSELARYLRGLNWAIPTMTLFVIGDTWPTTVAESAYVFVVLFFGVALQGFLVGNVGAVLSKDPRSAAISEQADRLGSFLMECGVSADLIQKVSVVWHSCPLNGIP